MADRIEREIEEILAKLDEGAPRETRKPISMLAHKDRKQAPAAAAPKPAATARMSTNITPAHLLLAGAGLVIGGLVLSGFLDAFIWVSFAGVVVFLSAFAWSFFRSPRPAAGSAGGGAARGHYWRDRWIEYEPSGAKPWDRVKRRFRR